jgi:hypothetical protein
LPFKCNLQRYSEDACAATKAMDEAPFMRFKRFADSIPSYTVDEAISGGASAAARGYTTAVVNGKWLVTAYMKAHIFWRCFTANPTVRDAAQVEFS